MFESKIVIDIQSLGFISILFFVFSSNILSTFSGRRFETSRLKTLSAKDITDKNKDQLYYKADTYASLIHDILKLLFGRNILVCTT